MSLEEECVKRLLDEGKNPDELIPSLVEAGLELDEERIKVEIQRYENSQRTKRKTKGKDKRELRETLKKITYEMIDYIKGENPEIVKVSKIKTRFVNNAVNTIFPRWIVCGNCNGGLEKVKYVFVDYIVNEKDNYSNFKFLSTKRHEIELINYCSSCGMTNQHDEKTLSYMMQKRINKKTL